MENNNSTADKSPSPRSKKEKKELKEKEKREKKERKEKEKRERRESIASAGSVSARSRSSSIVDGISDTAKKLANAISGGGASAHNSLGRNGGSKLARSSTTAAQLEEQYKEIEAIMPDYVPHEPQLSQHQSGSSSPTAATSATTTPLSTNSTDTAYEPIPLKRESSLRKLASVTTTTRPNRSSTTIQSSTTTVPPPQADHHDYLAKVIVIGESGVGKTALRSRYCENRFDDNYKSTIGVEFSNVILTVGNDGKDSVTASKKKKNLKLQIWDTAGQEKFRAVTSAYYRGTMGALLVYDITKHDTFERLAGWIDEINEHSDKNKLPVVMVIGNKKDLSTINRKVSVEEAKNWCAAKNYLFLETSAKSGEGVREAFQLFAELLYKQRIMTTQPVDDLGASLKKVPPSLKNTQKIIASNSTEETSSVGSILINDDEPNKIRLGGYLPKNNVSKHSKCAC